MKRRFELVDDTSNKFWEIEVNRAWMTVCFGRIGTAGSTKGKTFASGSDAEREAAKLVAEKTKKGYVEVGGAAGSEKSPPGRNGKPAKPTRPAKVGPKSKAVAALLEAIHAKEKWLVPHLRPEASADALATLRALDAPATMLALYAAHDGTESEMLGGYPLCPVQDIVAEREAMNELLAKNPAWQREGTWDPKWIPFMSLDGQLYCVDPSGSCNGGPPGQILFYDHGSSSTSPLRTKMPWSGTRNSRLAAPRSRAASEDRRG